MALNDMRHIFSINAEGGPLLCLDAQAAGGWKGSAAGSRDYENLSSMFDAQPELGAIVFRIGKHPAIAWEMPGPGTADVFVTGDGQIRIVRSWPGEDTPPEIERPASAAVSSNRDIGEIEIASRLLAVLWAAESGQGIPLSIEHDVQRVSGTAIDDSAFVMKVSSCRFVCAQDEVRVGDAFARRLILTPSLLGK